MGVWHFFLGLYIYMCSRCDYLRVDGVFSPPRVYVWLSHLRSWPLVEANWRNVSKLTCPFMFLHLMGLLFKSFPNIAKLYMPWRELMFFLHVKFIIMGILLVYSQHVLLVRKYMFFEDWEWEYDPTKFGVIGTQVMLECGWHRSGLDRGSKKKVILNHLCQTGTIL